ncbi:TraB/GumN family protein [Sphingomonas rhizophila]|uniref:TraB/GumN family protein n=1 Tax=Sphingomonas rhizophila TaxID=2071607 RepID=A0A7G9SE27_9SPHN|nr:TraB/GumN family protein [Sphingomonas rhizophila]QNN66102.1 TraB/GumN family protein [Sphingomonas rhizophila]
MLKKFIRSIAALAGLAAAPGLAATTALPDADPAIWMVKDKDTTLYLFGTVHALDGKQDWLNDEVKTAFDASSELVLEVITPDNPAELMPLLSKYAIDTSGRTLTSKLAPKYQAALAAALKRHNLKPQHLDLYKPFFASIMLSSLDFNQAGFTAEAGAEAVLRKQATAQGKRIDAVETMDKQMSFFAALDEPKQIALLEQTLGEGGSKINQDIGRLVAAWSRGDADRVAAELRAADTDSPELYRLLLVDRNREWADWIDRRMDQPGTVFMAVGAGHLAGPDSVQQFLKKRGIRSKRLKANYRVQ